jgi:hypothetical protein
MKVDSGKKEKLNEIGANVEGIEPSRSKATILKTVVSANSTTLAIFSSVCHLWRREREIRTLGRYRLQLSKLSLLT